MGDFSRDPKRVCYLEEERLEERVVERLMVLLFFHILWSETHKKDFSMYKDPQP